MRRNIKRGKKGKKKLRQKEEQSRETVRMGRWQEQKDEEYQNRRMNIKKKET